MTVRFLYHVKLRNYVFVIIVIIDIIHNYITLKCDIDVDVFEIVGELKCNIEIEQVINKKF